MPVPAGGNAAGYGDADPVSVVNLSRVSTPSDPPTPAEGGWIRRLCPYLVPHRRNVVIALVAAVVGQGLSALTPVFAAVVIDDGIMHRHPADLAVARGPGRGRPGVVRAAPTSAAGSAAGSASTCSTTCATPSSNGSSASTSPATTSSAPASWSRARRPTSA